MSQLKHFKVLNIYTDGTADLQCSRTDCKGKFTVNRKKFKTQTIRAGSDWIPRTRPCPYCFRVSVIPGQEPPF